METVIDKLSEHWPWVKTVIIWIGLSRTVLKPLGLLVTAGLTKFVEFLKGDGYANDAAWMDAIMRSRWYRWPAFFVDYIFSIKLPHAEAAKVAKDLRGQGNDQAASKTERTGTNLVGILLVIGAAVMVIGTLAFLTGCASPQYSPVPPASSWTNGVPEPQAKRHRAAALQNLAEHLTQRTPGTQRTESAAAPAVQPRVIVIAAPAFQYPWYSFSCGPTWDLMASSNLAYPAGAIWFVYPTNRYQVIGSDIYVTNEFPRMFFRIRIHC